MEELLSKLVSVLKAHGLADEEIEKVKLELSEEPEDKESEEKPEEKPETPSEEDSVAEGEEEVEESKESEPVESEPSEEDKSAEEPPMEEPEMIPEAEPELPVEPEEPEQPEMEESEKPELPEGVEEVDPNMPTPETMEPQGPSAADFEKVLSRLDEKDKAIEGLQAKVESLLEALEKSGVVSGVKNMSTEVGIDDGTRVMDFHSDETAVDDIVNELNKKRF